MFKNYYIHMAIAKLDENCVYTNKQFSQIDHIWVYNHSNPEEAMKPNKVRYSVSENQY
jgi:hypothetical protein